MDSKNRPARRYQLCVVEGVTVLWCCNRLYRKKDFRRWEVRQYNCAGKVWEM